ncbi:MAG: helix-turn-helix domain-containing protein [Verrucomicrobia bacterium]|nr:helix-turn-helix domain-containing protein [Verrucomicrobiota bacterium]
MPSVSDRLREAREALGLNVYQVADITKIRTDHIRALEEGRFDAFAAPVYVRGFIRTYARLLRLDQDEISAALDAELSQDPRLTEPSPLGGARRNALDLLMLQLSKVNWRIALPAIALLLLIGGGFIGYRLWTDYQSRDPLANLGPGLYHPPQGGDVLPLPAPAAP